MAKQDPFKKPAADDDGGFSIDATEVTSGYQIDKGDYPAKVIDVVKGESKAGNEMLTWTFAITGPKYPGKEMKTWTVMTPAALWKLCEVLEALGIEAKGKVVNFKKKDVIGKQCLIRVKDDVYNDEPSSKLDKCLPHPDGPIPKNDPLGAKTAKPSK
jgi:hypothetical protein